jgi:negative regulator of genetic competence, sporulation and motility
VQKGSLFGKYQAFSPANGRLPLRTDTPETAATSQCAAASGDQVYDEDDQGDHQQNVDQAAGNVKAEAENPQNKKNDENSPKHILSFAALAAAITQIKTGRIPLANSQ